MAKFNSVFYSYSSTLATGSEELIVAPSLFIAFDTESIFEWNDPKSQTSIDHAINNAKHHLILYDLAENYNVKTWKMSPDFMMAKYHNDLQNLTPILKL